MSIQAIQLRNFRGFSDVTLPLKPLTVLLGPNSSGKSSFSHPLAALAHCQRAYTGTRNASLTPENAEKASQWPIDLGGYRDLVTHGCNEKVYVNLLASEGWVEFGFGQVPTAVDELWFSHMAYPRNLDSNITEGQRANSAVTIPLSADLSKQVRAVPAVNSTVDVAPGINASLEPVNDTKLVLERINEQDWIHQSEIPYLGLDGLFPLNLTRSNGDEIKFNRKSVVEIRSLLQDLVYLRAGRERPNRGYPRVRSEQKSIGYEGQKAASVLLNRGDQDGIFICPPPSILAVKKKDFQINWKEGKATLQSAASKWLQHLQLAEKVQVSESLRYGSEYVDVRVTLRPGGASRDITEVGFAISQTLPIIIGALLQPRDSLLIVDLPEGHLHPGPQADMADLFCSLAMCGRSALVETHSEMFFHRLRLRAAMDPELMKRIVVYFVDAPNPDGTCRPPREIGLSFEQELTWPAGFLQEALDSEIKIRSVRQARTKA
jgi:predicted ATPase